MPDQKHDEDQRNYFYIEKKINQIEITLDMLRRDISELQKSDSRQMMIIIVLITGLLGLDITKVSLLFHNLQTQPNGANVSQELIK